MQIMCKDMSPGMWRSIAGRRPSFLTTLAMHEQLVCILAYQNRILPKGKHHHPHLHLHPLAQVRDPCILNPCVVFCLSAWKIFRPLSSLTLRRPLGMGQHCHLLLQEDRLTAQRPCNCNQLRKFIQAFGRGMQNM